MHISETAFPHLVAAADERMVRELEQRRVAAERQAEAQPGQQPVAGGAAQPRRGWLRRHPARRALGA